MLVLSSNFTCLLKVWYDEISDDRFDVRDYEELVGKYPYLVDSCVQEIRLGHREVAKPVKVRSI